MVKRTSKAVVKYKPLSAENDSAFKTERSLDTMTFSGSYLVEITHNGTDVGLPIDDCGEEHYIVGTLVVTDSGTGGRKQKNRVIGQALTITSRQSKNTKVYTRTLVNGHWNSWVDLGAAKTTDIQDGAITAQKLSSDVLANISKSANGTYWTSGPNAVTLNINKNDGTVRSQTLPAATTEKAGVMSADMLNAIAVNVELIENKVILATGKANTNANFDASDYITIPNSVIDLSASGWLAGGALLVAFYDSQKTFISGYGNFGDATSAFYSIVHFAIPENARYVRCSSSRVKDKTILVWGNREYNENIDALLPISIEWIDGEFVNRGGVTAVNSTWCRSDYVEVSEFSGITIKAYCRGTVLSCAFYDANYKYLSGIGDYGYTVMTAIHINAAVPADAKYMRVSTAVASKDDTVFLVNGMRIANNEDTITLDTFATQTIPAQFYRKQSGDSLRVLCFGSSWLTNTWWYLNKLTQAVGINATIKCYFSSACPFSKWVDRYEGKEETGTSTDFRRFDSVNGSDWSVEYVTDTTEFKRSLEENWDVIVFQQGSSDSTNWNSDSGYANHYQKLMSYIKRSAKPWTVICYNNTWTPKLGAGSTQTKEAQMGWQKANNDNCIKFTNAVGLSNFVIPCGAAVWALRNDSVITDADDFMKDDLHIKNGLPIYLTGLTLFRAVVMPFYGVDIDDIAWLPDESTQKNPSSESSWMSIDSEQAARVKQMVKLAFSNRYGFYTL